MHCMHWRQGVMSTSEAMLDEKQSLIRDLRAQIAAANAEAAVLATRSRQRAADNLQRTTCSSRRHAAHTMRGAARRRTA